MAVSRVMLSSVTGDCSAAFSDLVGVSGQLRSTAPTDRRDGAITFMPDNRSDWLVMLVLRRTRKGKEIRLRTHLGNTFTFRELTTAPVKASLIT